MAKFRQTQAQKVIKVKEIIMAVLGAPRYQEQSLEEFTTLYPQIPLSLIQQAGTELIAEGKVEAVPGT